MLNLEKITVFHKIWNSEKGAHDTIASVYDAHWFERQVFSLEGNGLVRSREVKVRIPKDLYPSIAISAGDKIARGELKEEPKATGVVLTVTNNWKGANPHWLVTGK